jgi:hypothetical protein
VTVIPCNFEDQLFFVVAIALLVFFPRMMMNIEETIVALVAVPT